MQLRLKREESLSSRDRRQLKHELERDRKLLNPPAVAKKRACPNAATGSSSSERVAKKAPVQDAKLTASCIGWRVRIMKHLKKRLDDRKCWQLLDEIKAGTPHTPRPPRFLSTTLAWL
jgi:hypothetical protein